MARRQPAEEGLLFDLPLDRPPETQAPAQAPAPTAEEIGQTPLPLADLEPEPAAPATAAAADSPPRPDAPEDAAPGRPSAAKPAAKPAVATLRRRAAAGLADLAVCVAVGVVLSVALLAQGLRLAAADWPAGALFLLTFSFLYSVLPLAFWGRTPGMALAGLRTTSRDGRPLSFRQAILNWLGSVLTMALAGLPLLLALGGDSLSDRISGAVTRRLELAG